MLTPHKLTEVQKQIRPLVRELFAKAYANQRYDGDLLIVYLHGHYDERNRGFILSDGRRASAYATGNGTEGIIFGYQYDVVKKLITAVLHRGSRRQAYAHHPFPYDQRNAGIEFEAMAYMAIWESDYFIKALYHVLRLCDGKRYNWKKEIPTVRYHEFWEKHIHKPLLKHVPTLGNIAGGLYQRDIRNAIAHRKYYCTTGYIHLFDAGYTHRGLKYLQWERFIMLSLVIYLEFFKALRGYHKLYAYKRRDYHYGQLIKIVDKDGTVLQNWWMKYLARSDRWIHYDNWFRYEYSWGRMREG